MNQSRIVDEGGAMADHYAISDVTWDPAQSKFKITIAHTTAAHSGPTLRLSQFVAGAVQSTDSVLSATVSAVYTDSTVYPHPYVYYNHPVGFGTPSPDQQVDIRGNIAMGRRTGPHGRLARCSPSPEHTRLLPRNFRRHPGYSRHERPNAAGCFRCRLRLARRNQ